MKFSKACVSLQWTMLKQSCRYFSRCYRRLSTCHRPTTYKKTSPFTPRNMPLSTTSCSCTHQYITRRFLATELSSQSHTNSTIFSLSSGHGKCGVAVVRLSGSSAYVALEKIARLNIKPKPREAILRRLVDPGTGVTIDKALVMYFPGPHSFTGEDCVEFHVHGGPAVISALLSALHNIPTCRQAEPGEFTKRAFWNGKMDLTEIEGLGDLIHAETEVQRRQALRQMDGDLSKLYTRWRSKIIKCVADLEAFIDFSEDQDIEESVIQQVKQRVEQFSNEISSHLNDNRQGEILREGVHVVIVGEPNVGKSSLLNSICQRPAAIVTNVAGTTRDVIETHVNIGGYPVLLSDTAGLRETQDIVEKEGVARAIRRANEADLIIIVLDCMSEEITSDNHDVYKHIFDQFEDMFKFHNDKERLEKTSSDSTSMTTSINEHHRDSNTIVVLNKIDLCTQSRVLEIRDVILKTSKTSVSADKVARKPLTVSNMNIDDASVDSHGSLYGDHSGHDLSSYANQIESRRQQCDVEVDLDRNGRSGDVDIDMIQKLVPKTDSSPDIKVNSFENSSNNSNKLFDDSGVDSHGSLYGDHEGHDLSSYANQIESRRQQCDLEVDLNLDRRSGDYNTDMIQKLVPNTCVSPDMKVNSFENSSNDSKLFDDSGVDTHGSLYGDHEGHDLSSYANQIESRRHQCDLEFNTNGKANIPKTDSALLLSNNKKHIPCHFVSCENGEGMDSFMKVLETKVAEVCGNPLTGHPSLTQTRHRAHLVKCLQHLDEFKLLIDKDDLVLASETLRWALQEIGKITGKISSEDILDVIFKDFCIGK